MSEHPILPTGFNSVALNGDDYDGPGVNFPVWPVFFDSFVALEVMIVTEQMIAIFDNECPDIVFPAVNQQILFPPEVRTQQMRRRA